MKDLFGDVPLPEPKRAFDGATYDAERDYARLNGQLGRVYQLMKDGHWRTLGHIAALVNGTEAAVSAKLRDLRKAKYGALVVERRHIKRGLFQYRVRP